MKVKFRLYDNKKPSDATAPGWFLLYYFTEEKRIQRTVTTRTQALVFGSCCARIFRGTTGGTKKENCPFRRTTCIGRQAHFSSATKKNSGTEASASGVERPPARTGSPRRSGSRRSASLKIWNRYIGGYGEMI